MASSSGAPPSSSRRRANLRRTGLEFDDTASDWANLPEGPAGLIAERILSDDVADYVRFRAACVSWRACTVEPRACSVLDRRFHPRRWIMLPPTLNVAGNRRLFLNVFTGECIRVHLPDPHCCYVLGHTAEGLVLLCRKETYLVQLLNPLTGQHAELPSATMFSNHILSLDEQLKDFRLRDAGLADDSTIALLFGYSNVAFAKPGDQSWTTRRNFYPPILSAFLFAGRFYCITTENILLLETMVNRRPELVQVANYMLGHPVYGLDNIYPVDNDGLLFICFRHGLAKFNHNSEDKYRTYRAIVDTGEMIPTKVLDGHSLFIDHCGTRSISVPAGISPSIKPDTIYVCKGYYMNSRRPRIDALDALGGSVEQPNFDEDDIAYYLSCYACVQDDLVPEHITRGRANPRTRAHTPSRVRRSDSVATRSFFLRHPFSFVSGETSGETPPPQATSPVSGSFRRRIRRRPPPPTLTTPTTTPPPPTPPTALLPTRGRRRHRRLAAPPPPPPTAGSRPPPPGPLLYSRRPWMDTPNPPTPNPNPEPEAPSPRRIFFLLSLLSPSGEARKQPDDSTVKKQRILKTLVFAPAWHSRVMVAQHLQDARDCPTPTSAAGICVEAGRYLARLEFFLGRWFHSNVNVAVCE
ncbi:hypothetical protein EJB05_57188, partial [Eragrostis curvula]